MASHEGDRSDNAQVIDTVMNQANDALNTGDFDVVKMHSDRVLNVVGLDKDTYTLANLIHFQVRTREGSFQGLLSKLEALFDSDSLMDSHVQAKVGNEIIRVCHRSGELKEGAAKGEELMRTFSRLWPVSEVVELFCQVSSCHYHRGDVARAEELATRALELAQKSLAPKSLAQVYWQLSLLSKSRGDPSLAFDQITQAKHWAVAAENNQMVPMLNYNAAIILLDQEDCDLEQVHHLAESAYLESLAQNTPGFAAYTCIALAETELRKGDHEGAMKYVNEGLKILPEEVIGPLEMLYLQKAKVLARIGRYEESKTWNNLAVRLISDKKPSREVAANWTEIGRVYVEIGFSDRGVFAYEKAIQIAGILREEPDIQVR